jgi:alcohol dehydrogenase (quinone), cytochrome c subunit
MRDVAMMVRHFIAMFLATVATLTMASIAPADEAADQALVKQGEYVARTGDCIACHTAGGGKPFAGGLPLQTPVGTIYTTNITPDNDTGIGTWSYDEFARLMRGGIHKKGYTVYPAMPYPSFSRMSDDDLKALYAYLMHGVAPVRQANRPTDIVWPLSMRWPLAWWRWLFAPKPHPFQPPPGADARIARGAYLVEVPGHCGACHTPRSFTLQEKALSSSDGTVYLSGGGAVDGWIPPSLRDEHGGGLAGWSESDIVQLLRTARNPHSGSFGGMNDVVIHSMQYLNDGDLAGIAAYLKTLPPNKAAAPYAYDDAVAKALFNGEAPTRGAQIYVDRCAGCHRTDGKGSGRVFPSLAGNSVLQTDDATSAIHMVLSGSTLPATNAAPSAFTMAPYARILSDQDIADVVSFIQASWGNAGKAATSSKVMELRKLAK